jgi:hypothetical protein
MHFVFWISMYVLTFRLFDEKCFVNNEGTAPTKSLKLYGRLHLGEDYWIISHALFHSPFSSLLS